MLIFWEWLNECMSEMKHWKAIQTYILLKLKYYMIIQYIKKSSLQQNSEYNEVLQNWNFYNNNNKKYTVALLKLDSIVLSLVLLLNNSNTL